MLPETDRAHRVMGSSVMGLNKLGPAAGGKKLPTREQLQRENERLKEKIKSGSHPLGEGKLMRGGDFPIAGLNQHGVGTV